MENFASIEDITTLWRALSMAENEKATALLEIVSDALRQEAKLVGRDLDAMIETGAVLPNVVKSVVVDIIARYISAPTDDPAVTQSSQSALGYSISATYLVPGGGLYIKNDELKRLGLNRPRYGSLEIYDIGGGE